MGRRDYARVVTGLDDTKVKELLARAAREHAASEAVQEQGVPAFRYGVIVCALRMFDALSSAPAFQALVERARERG